MDGPRRIQGCFELITVQFIWKFGERKRGCEDFFPPFSLSDSERVKIDGKTGIERAQNPSEINLRDFGENEMSKINGPSFRWSLISIEV